jgi:hypothetical protein
VENCTSRIARKQTLKNKAQVFPQTAEKDLVSSASKPGGFMNTKVIELAKSCSALEAIRKGLVRCGFELEFQSVNGISEQEDEDGESYMGDVENEISAPHIEVGSDSSVRGGEVRTVGALTPQEFMSAAIALFTAHDFEIDKGCSFHIHLSVPGVKHTYGKHLQAEMMAYLLENADRLPESVRDRLKSKAIRFCQFKLDSDKMRAVHGHPQRTWEFRLFGNVHTPTDAWRCLLLAIDALRHAYRVKLELAKPLVSAELIVEFDALASEAITNMRSIRAQARYNKVIKNQNNAV